MTGLSAAAMRQLRALDRGQGWPDNRAAEAIRVWCGAPRGGGVPWHGDDYDWRNPDDPRAVIEVALRRLSRRARRELRAVIGPADDRRRRLWIADPFAPPELPWWLRTWR
ncbi:hypothetical protein ACFY36_31795 [Actinoplanes sp. NPDC000266]